MNKILRKEILLPVIFILALGLNIKIANADYSPAISNISSIKSNYITLKIRCLELEDEDVDIKVHITNLDSDAAVTKNFELTLNSQGYARLKIDNLDPATAYRIKYKIKKSSDNSFSQYSAARDATTKGLKYSPKIHKIFDIDRESLVIKADCAKLKNKKVNIQVRIENKDNDSILTKNFETILNNNAKTDIRITGLDSATLYGFKIKVKKSSDSLYSKYSREKTAETED